MTEDPAIIRALTAHGLDTRVKHVTTLDGGCIAKVRRVELKSGKMIVAKLSGDHSRLVEEADGLSAIAATGTVRVPEVMGVSEGVLLLEYLAPGEPGSDDWQTFGKRLAELHMADVGNRYGWEHDNHLGDTIQVNQLHDDWVAFNRVCRFGPLRSILQDGDEASDPELEMLDAFINGLETLIPARPRPALIHGDLWKGNAIPIQDSGIAVIDPAVSIGDGLADVAMMQLFGGFPNECFDAYARAVNIDLSCSETARSLKTYRLYHVLNHWVLFGRGYAPEALDLMRFLEG